MIRKLTLVFALSLSVLGAFGQETLDYYLPKNVSYAANIPTPKQIIGHEVGEWHITHDRLVQYMQAVAQASDRVTIETYGHSHEGRPQVLLTITSPENHAQLETLRQKHLAISDPAKSGSLNLDEVPLVIWMGYSVHGNEPSGSNAALVVAYHLAAAQGGDIDQILKNTIILLDPSFNPDGMNRFASWVNSHKSHTLVTDPNTREYNEEWPRGRTNHYWFDLNRDWLPVQQPESVAKVAKFQAWRPNILTDHHEMGSNSTFFFQPGVPSRTNPLTPPINQELTGKIGEFHAKALDQLGSLYFTKEGYDDFYYGKASTYPDANGCIGILFEQASSRGHAQETTNGLLTFPFTIRNQVTTSFSTLQAGHSLRKDLLAYQRSFYAESGQRAGKDAVKGYVFGSEYDPARLFHLLDILNIHQIGTYPLKQAVTINGKNFQPGKAFVVPLNQPQYTLIKGIFGTQTTFTDSLFYDISSWTFPLAFGLDHAELTGKPALADLMGNEVAKPVFPKNTISGRSKIGYILEWDAYYAPKALYALLDKGVKVKATTKPVSYQMNGQSKTYPVGTLFIPLGIQTADGEQIYQYLQQLASENAVTIQPMETGLSENGVDLGSNSLQMVRQPKVLLLVGEGVDANEAGEVWHLLDQRFRIPMSMIELESVGQTNLDRYTAIVMVDGSYSGLGTDGTARMREWVRNGGTLVAMKRAAVWAKQNDLSEVEFKSTDARNTKSYEAYADYANNTGALETAGAIFEVEADLTHPLAWGYRQAKLPFFRDSNITANRHKNPYATPFRYTSNPLISGYIQKENLEKLKGSAAVLVDATGRGRVISLLDNPNFRAFWFGTNKIFMNSLFFGSLISGGTSQ